MGEVASVSEPEGVTGSHHPTRRAARDTLPIKGREATVNTVNFEYGDYGRGSSDVYGKTPVSTAFYGARRA
jgi:hypothetical protein